MSYKNMRWMALGLVAALISLLAYLAVTQWPYLRLTLSGS